MPRPVDRIKYAELVGYGGLLAFAASAWSTRILHHYFLVFCLAWVLVSREARAALVRDPIMRLGVVFAGYFAAQSLWGYSLFPDTLDRQWLDFQNWLLLFGFLPIAWWLRGDPRRIFAVFICAALGLFLGMGLIAGIRNVVLFNTGPQTGFLLSAQLSGPLAATVLLGVLLFSGRMMDSLPRPWLFGLGIIALGGAGYLSAYMLVASQSRMSWLAFILALGFALIWQYRLRNSSREAYSQRRKPWLWIVMLLIPLAGMALNADTIMARIAPDSLVVKTLLGKLAQGQMPTQAELPVSSFGYRYHVQKFGIEKWLERPIIGWGTGSVKHLIKSSQRPELFMTLPGQWMGGFHNTPLEILVRFGVIGAGLFSYLAWRIIRDIRAAELGVRMPPDLLVFMLGAVLILILGMLTETRFIYDYWRSYWFLMMGALYTFVLHPEKPLNKENT